MSVCACPCMCLEARDGSDRQGSDECMLFTALWVFKEVSEATNACYLQRLVLPGIGRTAKEATNACYLQHFGSSGRYRPQRRRMHAIYNTLRPQGGIGSHECMLFIILCPPRDGSDRQGSDDCMLFTTLWAPREVSEAKEATNACYLNHFGHPGRYRKRRIHAIYTTLSPQE